MQLLIPHELTQKENYWLQHLRSDLKAGNEIREIVSRYEQNRHSKDYAAVMDLITRANWKEMEVERNMCEALRELFSEELKEENTPRYGTWHRADQAHLQAFLPGKFSGGDCRTVRHFPGKGQGDT